MATEVRRFARRTCSALCLLAVCAFIGLQASESHGATAAASRSIAIALPAVPTSFDPAVYDGTASDYTTTGLASPLVRPSSVSNAAGGVLTSGFARGLGDVTVM